MAKHDKNHTNGGVVTATEVSQETAALDSGPPSDKGDPVGHSTAATVTVPLLTPADYAAMKMPDLLALYEKLEKIAEAADQLNEIVATRLQKGGFTKINVGGSDRRIRGVNGKVGVFRLYDAYERKAKPTPDISTL